MRWHAGDSRPRRVRWSSRSAASRSRTPRFEPENRYPKPPSALRDARRNLAGPRPTLIALALTGIPKKTRPSAVSTAPRWVNGPAV
jgi:hypothetical protein